MRKFDRVAHKLGARVAAVLVATLVCAAITTASMIASGVGLSTKQLLSGQTAIALVTLPFVFALQAKLRSKNRLPWLTVSVSLLIAVHWLPNPNSSIQWALFIGMVISWIAAAAILSSLLVNKEPADWDAQVKRL